MSDRISTILEEFDRKLAEHKAALEKQGSWFAGATKRGKPTKPAALAELEDKLGIKLPASYRRFLELANGYADNLDDPSQFVGLFSTKRLLQPDDDVLEFREADPDDEVARRGLVIGQHMDCVVLIDGETIVVIDSEREHIEFATLDAFLEHQLAAFDAARSS